ncbi:glycerophosphoryl diester phosphodiesterase membrane domain-containing protein [Streptomyces sp. NPDC058662]|uniref:glycerophosphoryl diester phosphodiesterase membrane domain-containing protein n=1 Tax=Streptomyces sp. NPDC058662 TaxID=3346583 RepID=UPI003667C2CD
MTDSPGWATPGSEPSDGDRSGAPADRPGPAAQPPAPPVQPAQPPAQPAAGPKWSAEQPPPGQWSSPAPGQQAPPQQPPQGAGWGADRPQPGGPYGGQYGPPQQGGPYGYPGGPGPWGKPPAAKPGVIPLRPLGLGEILDGAVATMRTHWRSVLPITLVVATVVQVISLFATKFMMDDLIITADADMTPADAINALGTTLSVTVVTQFLQYLGTIVVTAMLTMIFSRAILGQNSSISDAWRDSRAQLLRLIGLTALLGGGLIVLAIVLMLPAILSESIGLIFLGLLLWVVLAAWLGTLFSLASPALMLEKSGVFKAFSRSAKLVKGSWWRIFGITVLTAIMAAIISAIIYYPLSLIGLFGFGGGLDALQDGTATTAWGTLIFSAIGLIIAQTIVTPFQSGVTVLLYVDQRIRREALDLELARAAGVENYGTTGG